MAKYQFVGFPIVPDGTVDVPDDAIIVGANFNVQSQWQIMCLMPLPVKAAPKQEAAAEEEKTEEGTEDANVPPES
jgi:hypothetical protein